MNPQGLQRLQLWQTDVTRFTEFVSLKYVHPSNDTFSDALYASCHTGEKSKDVRSHFLQAFAILGIPAKIKTDNGPAYTLAATQTFLSTWGITHVTGTPHSPTGQSIIERAHQTLKHLLLHKRGGMGAATPEERLQKALHGFKFLIAPSWIIMP